MLARKFIVSIVFFLFFSVSLLGNADAGIFDTVTVTTANYGLIYSQSGAYAVSNMITYDNKIEIVYASSIGIKNLVLTNISGAWTANTYTVSGDVESSIANGYSLIQNATELHLFYCLANASEINFKHYMALKSNHAWSLVEQNFVPPFYGGYCNTGDTAFIFDKNDNKTIYGAFQIGIGYNTYWVFRVEKNAITGAWTTDSGYGYCGYYGCGYNNGGWQLDISQSVQTNNRFLSYGDGIVCPYHNERRYMQEITTLSSYQVGIINNTCEDGNGIRMASVLPFKNIDVEYYANVHGNTYELSYVFDTSDTLGVNCSAIAGTNYYFCKENIYNGTSSHYIPVTSQNVPIRTDSSGNLHILYSTSDSKLAHIYQDNSYSSWKYENVINLTNEASFKDFVLFGNPSGIVVYYMESGSNEIEFWFVGGIVPSPPAPPVTPSDIPPATSDSSFMGLICNGGVWLTGTTYEGGCLVASLFILAIFLSIVGWIFKYIEIEFKQEIPDKYLISGLISLGLMITFAIIGIADLITTILGFFMITAILISYYERGREK